MSGVSVFVRFRVPYRCGALSLIAFSAMLGTGRVAAAQSSGATKPEDTTREQVAAKGSDEAALLTSQLATLVNDKDAEADEIAATILGPAGMVPVTKGFNLSLTTASQHDAAGGWSNILSPNIAYRFDRHFSVNAGVSTFPYINVVTTQTTKNAKGVVTKTVSSLTPAHFLLSDTNINASFDAHARLLDYNLTATLGVPTGDDSNGLGAGQVTYAVMNHFEHPLGEYVTPNIELGIDDSPNLLTPRVAKSYLVVGESAHFQAGLDISLPWHNIEFETDAYEELPIGSNTVKSTTTKGKKGKLITVTTPESVGEDNGFTNSLDIPLSAHVTLSGFYNRSLRNHDDTAGFSLTFLLRGARRAAERADAK